MPYKDPEKAKSYREANKEKRSAANKAWREANRDSLLADKRAYYAANKAALRARERTPERQAARSAYGKKWRTDNADHVWAYAMQWKYDIPLWMAPYIAERMATGNCPGCGVPFGHPKSMIRACIDHDHDTGLVRMIVCNPCNTPRLRGTNDGGNPDALLLAAGRNAKRSGRKHKARALIQLRLATLLIDHYAPQSPLVAKALSIPLPDDT
jgi:hypothetical protein